MDLKQLKELKKDIEKAISRFEARRLANARRELEAKAAELGVSLSVNGGVKFGHCGGAKVGQFGASALERAALI